VLTLALLFLAACAAPASPGGQPSATPSGTGPAPTGGTTARVWELRYVLLDRYPDFAYCDPDYYPVARADEQAAADDWWAGVDRTSAEVVTILAQRGLVEPLTPGQRLDAYRDHKRLMVIGMTEVAGGYEYELSVSSLRAEPDQTVRGVVTLGGAVSEHTREPRVGGCPICLEAGTRIATPDGERSVGLIRPGDLVWTTDAGGHRVVAPVVQVRRRATPGPQLMLRLALADGRVLVAAGAHPASDGRYLRHLRVGDHYDGSSVTTVGWTRSASPETFDILPAGPTGSYWADGVLVGSTLTA
jgi:hypothetical protein